MNPSLVTAASKTVPNLPVLVNIMRLRVKQLAAGHRALIVHPPGLGLADIALREIIEGKLTFERDIKVIDEAPLAEVIPFKNPSLAKRAA